MASTEQTIRRDGLRKMNEHATDCQLCQSGMFCDVLERISDAVENKVAAERSKQDIQKQINAGIYKKGIK